VLLLNIADIHFRHPHCTTDMDPHRPYRTRLVQDARERRVELGDVDAILVTGDIAFAGKPEEYEAAFNWLQKLAEACGCAPSKIFVVPGNHDVDRSITRANQSVKNVQSAIKRAPVEDKHNELLRQFDDANTRDALFTPIQAYNEFAARFDCQLYKKERLFWQHEIPFSSQTKLVLHGLTSTYLSGYDGQNDVRQSLYLSPLQTVLDPADGVINAVMCHHPPDWCIDTDDIEDDICERASLHFFGHKHRQRMNRDVQYVRFGASAVNPDKNERGWEPGYNLVQLDLNDRDGKIFLDVAAHIRVWQSNPGMFRAKHDVDGSDVFRHQLPMPSSVRLAKPLVSPATTVTVPPSQQQNDDRKGELEATMSEQRTRDLVLRFWSLASSERRDIALALNLITQEDMQLEESERYGRALRLAGRRNVIDRLAEEISKREAH
jgi:3',5'-cyclic AMP phosphodiesterase CpdA